MAESVNLENQETLLDRLSSLTLQFSSYIVFLSKAVMLLGIIHFACFYFYLGYLPDISSSSAVVYVIAMGLTALGILLLVFGLAYVCHFSFRKIENILFWLNLKKQGESKLPAQYVGNIFIWYILPAYLWMFLVIFSFSIGDFNHISDFIHSYGVMIFLGVFLVFLIAAIVVVALNPQEHNSSDGKSIKSIFVTCLRCLAWYGLELLLAMIILQLPILFLFVFQLKNPYNLFLIIQPEILRSPLLISFQMILIVILAWITFYQYTKETCIKKRREQRQDLIFVVALLYFMFAPINIPMFFAKHFNLYELVDNTLVLNQEGCALANLFMKKITHCELQGVIYSPGVGSTVRISYPVNGLAKTTFTLPKNDILSVRQLHVDELGDHYDHIQRRLTLLRQADYLSDLNVVLNVKGQSKQLIYESRHKNEQVETTQRNLLPATMLIDLNTASMLELFMIGQANQAMLVTNLLPQLRAQLKKPHLSLIDLIKPRVQMELSQCHDQSCLLAAQTRILNVMLHALKQHTKNEKFPSDIVALRNQLIAAQIKGFDPHVKKSKKNELKLSLKELAHIYAIIFNQQVLTTDGENLLVPLTPKQIFGKVLSGFKKQHIETEHTSYQYWSKLARTVDGVTIIIYIPEMKTTVLAQANKLLNQAQIDTLRYQLAKILV